MRSKVVRMMLVLFVLPSVSCYPQNQDRWIVIINVENSSRLDIANALRILDSFKPKVISVDLQFSSNKDYDSDSSLVDALWSAKNLVMVSIIEDSSGTYTGISPSHRYEFAYGSLPEFIPFEAKTGYPHTLFEADEFQTVKRFSAFEKVGDKIEYHFAIQTAMIFDSLKTNLFLKRNSKTINIDYKKTAYNKIVRFSIYDLLNNKISKDQIEDKIILIGFVGPGNKDKYFTSLNSQNPPKSPDMYGLEILACIILQILD